uniref:Uncharacterized protein n=1 Tax=Panagrolaimus davidi TaxID=227884 RepID=A0A914QAB1_9BILA
MTTMKVVIFAAMILSMIFGFTKACDYLHPCQDGCYCKVDGLCKCPKSLAKEIGIICNVQKKCPSNMICVNSECVNRPPPKPETAEESIPDCLTTSDCKWGLRCVSGKCLVNFW